ncbi:MAG: hypothetical protein ACYCPO_07500 [Acidobacteriaceae bacterium]
MKPWSTVESAIEQDLRGIQLRLPFPDVKTIDVARCCAILHIVSATVYRLLRTPLHAGSDEMSLHGYNTMRFAPIRIEYASVVRFCDVLRERHGIPDRRPAPTFGRWRDEELLPFPWADTITTDDAAGVLGIDRSKVLLRIEAGQFEAYQIVGMSDWRISKTSLAKVIASFGIHQASARPYGGKIRAEK